MENFILLYFSNASETIDCGGFMGLKKGVYIIECIPKKENLREGALIYEFLNMIIPDRIALYQIGGKNDFLSTLSGNNSQVVHISCHGNIDDGNFYMVLPQGKIYPEEFWEGDGLRGRSVVLTGCSLGKAGFAKKFLKETHAELLIAPQKPIDFADSAMWCINFYYHLLARSSFSCGKSYDYLYKKFYIPGAMQKWTWISR